MITAHADVVGSLLRPPELLKAREQLATGTITAGQFKEIEDKTVDDAIALQEEPGLGAVTDGESVGIKRHTQFSTLKPGTRLNSSTLLVTSRTLRLSACAAISKSIEPIGRPLFSRSALVWP